MIRDPARQQGAVPIPRAKRAGASEVRRVFVEGNKVIAGEGFMNGVRDLVGRMRRKKSVKLLK
jgi:hypothetical protein